MNHSQKLRVGIYWSRRIHEKNSEKNSGKNENEKNSEKNEKKSEKNEKNSGKMDAGRMSCTFKRFV